MKILFLATLFMFLGPAFCLSDPIAQNLLQDYDDQKSNQEDLTFTNIDQFTRDKVRSDEWKISIDEARSLYYKGEYNNALIAANKTLSIAESYRSNPRNISRTLYVLGGIYFADKQLDKAYECYLKAFNNFDGDSKINSYEKSKYLTMMAIIDYRQGEMSSAEDRFKSAFEFYKNFSPCHLSQYDWGNTLIDFPVSTTILNYLGEIYSSSGDKKDKRVLYLKALQAYNLALDVWDETKTVYSYGRQIIKNPVFDAQLYRARVDGLDEILNELESPIGLVFSDGIMIRKNLIQLYKKIQSVIKADPGSFIHVIYFRKKDGIIKEKKNSQEEKEDKYFIDGDNFAEKDERLENIEKKIQQLENQIRYLTVAQDIHKIANYFIINRLKDDNNYATAVKLYDIANKCAPSNSRADQHNTELFNIFIDFNNTLQMRKTSGKTIKCRYILTESDNLDLKFETISKTYEKKNPEIVSKPSEAIPIAQIPENKPEIKINPPPPSGKCPFCHNQNDIEDEYCLSCCKKISEKDI